MDYTPPWGMKNGHVQSVFASMCRKNNCKGLYQRERMDTPDGDFLDLDWAVKKSSTLVILSHGLEGDTHRPYVTGMVRAVNQMGWDALAWNYRSCSGTPNRYLRFYHNGVTEDLSCVINHALNRGRYREIYLVGFSLGGNLTLVHLGRDRVHPAVKKAVVFSVPCHLAASAKVLARPGNRLYMERFLRKLRKKIKVKMAMMPGEIDDEGYEQITDFKGFDDRYTAPLHGFRDAEDYWEKCSSLQFVPHIKVPTLIVSALNDPFLSPECYPVTAVLENPHVTLEMTRSGGHVGFVAFNKTGEYWSEKRAMAFLKKKSMNKG
jgi:predicted alpha/beta-fold hydrolase